MMLSAILSAVLALGASQEVAPAYAEAIARYARTPTEAAFMAAWVEHESSFQWRIVMNECRKWECDKGRAVGAWQLHRGAAAEDWAVLPGNIDAQARAAARMTRWALRQCPGDAVRGGFRVLGGLGCHRALKGEQKRVASFRKARALL